MLDLTNVSWNRLYYYYLVGKVKNITLAAKAANLDQSGMSRHMIALEKELGVPLLLRKRDGVSFTEIGESVYKMACEMVQLSIRENEKIEKLRNDMSGTLRILTTQGIMRIYTDYLPQFYDKFPDIQLHFSVSRNYDDINNSENYDIAILPKFDENNDLEYIPLKKEKLAIFASQGYLKKRGTPKKPEDLDHHKLIQFSSSTIPSLGFTDFHLTLGRKDKKMRKAYLHMGTADSLIAACQKDMGIIAFIDEKGVNLPENLVKILESYSKDEYVDLHFIFKKISKDSRKIKEFIQFFKKCW